MIPRKIKRAGLYTAVAILGFVVGVVGLYLHKIRSGPCLETWHSEKLSAEFKASRTDEIQTFEDYMRLEDELIDLAVRSYRDMGQPLPAKLVKRPAGERTPAPEACEPDAGLGSVS